MRKTSSFILGFVIAFLIGIIVLPAYHPIARLGMAMIWGLGGGIGLVLGTKEKKVEETK